jgi:hypothetical protein
MERKLTIPVLVLVVMMINSSCHHGQSFQSLRERIDLAGTWYFALDTSGIGVTNKWFSQRLTDSVTLPGTLDENKKGTLNRNTTETMRLSRERMYEGYAWYQKEIDIPNGWTGKNIAVVMERTKPTAVWIDTVLAGKCTDILTPQQFNLTQYLKPGKHTLTILVDNGPNSVPQGVKGSHAWTEHTQTNWNGIIGGFYLEASNVCHIENVQVFPDVAKKQISVKVKIQNQGQPIGNAVFRLEASLWNSANRQDVSAKSVSSPLGAGENIVTLTYGLGEKAELWSEFSPSLYKLTVTLINKKELDNASVDFGLRRFTTRGTQFVINGITTFLRGKHDACVFPLTAHPPMDVAGWRRVFQISKTYGINHYRFHSWTPPLAAFEAADIEGIYIQPELPFWGGFSKDKNLDLNAFLLKEGKNILNTYGNHASFVMFALGNELSGDNEVMKGMVKQFRAQDNRHLYGFGSNNYLGTKGYMDGEDYYTTCRVGEDTDTTYRTHTRASFSFADAPEGGYVNGRYPSTNRTYSSAISTCPIPVIGHEIGQSQMYPDYDEMKKYTGILKPWNFEVFRQRLNEHGLGDQAKDFFRASGAASMICYREDVEMALRTPGFGGFHLLDLQDFPGQGTALIGVLDAFMDSKGLITPEEFRHFCNQVVPLLEMKKYCWTNNETFTGKIQVANYSASILKSQKINWEVKDNKDSIFAKGSIEKDLPQGSLTDVTNPSVELSRFGKAMKLTLTIRLEGTPYINSYPIWVYPSKPEIADHGDIVIAEKPDARFFEGLASGKKVLFFPAQNDVKDVSVGGLFTPDYWNYRMFKGISEWIKKPVSPGTMGILTNPELPLFNSFPTEFHTNWQWWSIVKNSRPLILDNTPADYRPLVQVIDNIERNHKLGLIFEFTVGKGKLLVCMSDLTKIKDQPEARQLFNSILSYMSTDQFSPKQQITGESLKALLSGKVSAKKIDGVKNISYQ